MLPLTNKIEATTTTTTTTLTKQQEDQYRFGGRRYQMQGTPTNGPSWMVPEVPGLFAFPAGDTEDD